MHILDFNRHDSSRARRAWQLALFASMSTVAVLAALPAQAAPEVSSVTASTDAAPADGAVSVGEVVVTSRRKTEDLQKVPLTITAVTASTIAAAGVEDIQGITFLSSGITFSSDGAEANEQLVIRGVSDTSGGLSGASPASVFFDGVYVANPSAIDFNAGGLDRVEIVEGPVSALYGRNAFSGAVNYVTTKPTDQLHFNISDTVGDYGKDKLDAGVSGAIVPGVLTAGISGTYNTFNGTYYDPTTGQHANGYERKDFLASFVWTPTNFITISPVVYVGSDHFAPAATVTYAQNCALTTGRSYCGNLADNQIGPYFEAPDKSGAEGLNRQITLVSTDAKATGAWGTFDALFGYNSVKTQSFGNFDGQQYGLLDYYYAGTTPVPGEKPIGTVYVPERYGNHATEGDTSIELRYDTPSNYFIRGALGGYYLDHNSSSAGLFSEDSSNVPAGDHLDVSFDYSNGGSPFNIPSSPLKTHDLSGFGSLEWDIIPTVTAAASVRYTSEKQTEVSIPPMNHTFGFVTSNESLTWKVTPLISVYAAVANGELAGGFNGEATGDTTYQPETNWNYELGAKSVLFDGHLRLNGDVFLEDINDLQVEAPIPGTITLGTSNAGSVTDPGFEFTADYVPGNGFKGSLNFAYVDPTFTNSSYDFESGTYSQNAVVACSLIPSCAPRLATVNGVEAIKLSGLQVPLASKVELSVSSEYRHPFPILEGFDWFVRGDYHLESKQYSDVTNFSYYGPRNIFNFDGGIENGNWTITARVLNILNDKTPVTMQYNAAEDFDGSPLFAGRPGNVSAGGISWIPTSVLPDGRRWEVEIGYKF